MNNEEKFKKLLHEKLDAKDFPFDMKHWDSMRATIDNSRDNRSRKAVLFFLCLACIIGTVSLYFYTGIPTKTIASTDAPKVIPAPANESSHNQTSSITVAKTALTPGLDKKQVAIKNKINPPSLKAEQVTTETTKPEKVIAANEIRKNPAIPVQEVPEKASTGKAFAIPAEELPPVKTETTDKKFENSTLVIATKIEEPKTESPENVKSDEVVIKENDVVINEQTSPVEVKAVVTETVANTSAPLVTDSVALNSPKAADLILPLEDNLVKNSIYLEGGANYLAGWKIDDKKDGNGFNPVAGISYQYAINRRYALSTGLHYTSVRNLNAFSHQSEETTYGFGVKKEITVITPEKIHYLQLPIKLNVMLNAKNIIGAGYTFGYLLTVNSKVEKYSDGVSTGSSPVVSKATGYTHGFNKYDSQISIFYRRLLYKKIYLNAEALYGLSDAKKNSFFSSSAMERNMGLKITIMYNIFQK